MHVGVIPDGNRRWCRAHGMSGTQLLRVLGQHLLILVMGWPALLEQHAELRRLRELSVYCLSADNVRSRDPASDTFVMVHGLLELLLALATACDFLRHSACAAAPSSSLTVWCDAERARRWMAGRPQPDARVVRRVWGVRVDASEFGASLPWRLDSASKRAPGVTVRLRPRAGQWPPLVESCATDAARWLQMLANTVRVRVVGEVHLLGARQRDVIRGIASSMARPQRHVYTVNLAVAYDPLADMRRLGGCLLTRAALRRADAPSPIDLVIRTSGERRSSGFFPVQIMQAEWAYPRTLFPDFGVSDAVACLREFQSRDRRFGA